MQKIFGIGFHKTGTTSLNVALSEIGYRVTGPNGINDPKIESNMFKMCHDLVPLFDAFLDNPWPFLYQKIDKLYPESKYILTIRPVDQWIKSIITHFGSQTTEMRKMIYGVGFPLGNEDIYKARYEQHNNEVLKYFADRPDDLLVLKITAGEGWEKLAPFLGINMMDSFPHKNKAIDR